MSQKGSINLLILVIFLILLVLGAGMGLRYWWGLPTERVSREPVVSAPALEKEISTISVSPVAIEGPVSLKLLGSYSLDDAKKVYVSGNYAYIADGSRGLVIVNISNPSNPNLVGNYSPESPYKAGAVYVIGKYAYLGEDRKAVGARFEIIDISNPSNLISIGTYNTSDFWFISNIYVSGNYAYVTGGNHFLIIDVSKPNNPALVMNYESTDLKDDYYDTYLFGGKYVYLAGEGSLKILDISNYKNPILVGTYKVDGRVSSVYVSDKYAFIIGRMNNSFKFQTIDISNLHKPTMVGEVEGFVDFGQDIFILNKYAYVANDRGLTIIDISNPKNPIQAATCSSDGCGVRLGSYGVYVSNGYAYLASGNSGLEIIDISIFK